MATAGSCIEVRTIPASYLESRLSKSGCNPHKSAVSENAKVRADLKLQFEFEGRNRVSFRVRLRACGA